MTIDFHSLPDAHGRFGAYGGVYVAETLMAPLAELTAAYERLRVDPAFIAEFDHDLKHYVGRPSPIYHAQSLSRKVGGAQILLKREDLNHTGAHKINNTMGQALLAKPHGQDAASSPRPAPASTASPPPRWRRAWDSKCVVYMGAVDIERQAINVFRMKLLGATVVPVQSGSKTLKDALNEATARLGHQRRARHLLHHRHGGRPRIPIRTMVRDFNAVVGR